ncbi:class I SAM-dependent methyltransferase [Halobiforma nitratireducens]|uniref:Ubiquinone/menaquinone biosynthesis methyltransferase UbiE n=1 Tax=Halobiforma nitratireducens JCM 10879 TaxID=1227454 RepID=M0LPI4_9EURY|nr:class I SAM-dependent methyltransferase [Halobiforma nitratireducens]EMA35411.1 ubiquinone/menaquinone biosynthesis methyltransferase UbiE [Halobiforma nitratireducens JCM 10879]
MVEKDAVRRSYDELATTHADRRSEDGRGTTILESFLDSLPASPRVLDAGCGQGTPVLERLAAGGAAPAPVGLDFSREQLLLAADAVPDAELTQGDMTALPFADDTFDGVVAYWSLIHVPLEDHRTVLDEFARVLRPAGRVLVCEGANEWCGENPDWLETGVRMEWNVAGAERTRAQLRDAGFDVVETWGLPETLREDADEASEDGNSDDETPTDEDEIEVGAEDEDEDEDEEPWTFFEARLVG